MFAACKVYVVKHHQTVGHWLAGGWWPILVAFFATRVGPLTLGEQPHSSQNLAEWATQPPSRLLNAF
jgi:hypothetical protein